MHLITGRTLDRVLILDRQHLERLRIHRKARIDQLSGSWALDEYAVHSFLGGPQTDEPVQIKVRYFRDFPEARVQTGQINNDDVGLSGALDQRLDLNGLV